MTRIVVSQEKLWLASLAPADHRTADSTRERKGRVVSTRSPATVREFPAGRVRWWSAGSEHRKDNLGRRRFRPRGGRGHRGTESRPPPRGGLAAHRRSSGAAPDGGERRPPAKRSARGGLG